MNTTIHAINTPTIVTILGGTGDLARTKLLPSLLDLEAKELLPDRCAIVGFSRRDWGSQEYQEFVRNILEDRSYSDEVLERFLARVRFVSGGFDDRQAFKNLEQFLDSYEDEWGQCINKLLYLAVPPRFYEAIITNIGATGLPKECSGDTGYSRVIVEKPFGRNLETAQALDALLGEIFREAQIFRIDHYLGKDTVQNLLTFRFTNVLFENSWDRDDIQSVRIRMNESGGVEDRGEFYDAVGALRDVGQNHLLQMLALVGMESPGELAADQLRDRREKLLSALRVYHTSDEVAANTARGQYAGYRDIEGVEDDSDTETYFKLRAYIDNERWQDVPFILEAGKELAEKCVDIVVTFRAKLPCVCGANEDHEHKNVLTIKLQPEHGIKMRFWIKQPGLAFHLSEKSLSFEFEESELAEQVPDAYEKLLFDCIQGDQTLFVSTAEVRAAWAFITPILEAWQSEHAPEMIEYEKGSEVHSDLRFKIEYL